MKIILKTWKKSLIFIFLFFNITSLYAQAEIPRDIFIAAVVQHWLYFEVSPLDLNFSPDLVTPQGEFNIGETEDISFKVGTNNDGGWEIKIEGKNGGLKSLATGYLLATVKGTSTLKIKKEGYGGQATTTLAEVIINPIYNYYLSNTVGEIPQEYRVLATRYSKNPLGEVAKMKIKASAAVTTPAAGDYEEEIILTIIPLL